MKRIFDFKSEIKKEYLRNNDKDDGNSAQMVENPALTFRNSARIVGNSTQTFGSSDEMV